MTNAFESRAADLSARIVAYCQAHTLSLNGMAARLEAGESLDESMCEQIGTYCNERTLTLGVDGASLHAEVWALWEDCRAVSNLRSGLLAKRVSELTPIDPEVPTMTVKKLDAVNLLLSDARGVYIPRDFVCGADGQVDPEHCAKWGLTDENRESWIDAAKPDSECYWEAWNWIIDNAEFTDVDGSVFRLHQDGDLWAVCFERMTDEQKHNFGFDE